jgi:hypothetical protein
MRPQIVTILTFALVFFNGVIMLGQSSTAESGPPPPPQRTPPELFIDSNILMLVIAGLIYGGYVILRKNKAKNILD